MKINANEERVTHINKHQILKRKLIYIIIFILFMLSLSGFYLCYAWNRYQDTASSEAIQLAQSMESILHPEHILKLSGGIEDIEKPEYLMTKLSLTRLVQTNKSIRFAYLLGEQNGNMVFLLDSESPDSPDYSPPGQVYTEADDICWEPFKLGNTVLTQKRTDRWGKWISALVPIKDPVNGSVIAVLGIDYPASDWSISLWKKMIPDIIIVFCSFALFLALLHIWVNHLILKKINEKLTSDEALYRSVFDQAPIGISIVNDKTFTPRSKYGYRNINAMYEQILGRSCNELAITKWPEITHPDDLQADVEKFEKFQAGEIKNYSIEKRFIKPDGSIVWVHMIVTGLNFDKNHNHICLISDITKHKAMIDEIEKHQHQLLSFFDSNQDLIYLKDDNFRHIIANKALAGFFGTDVNSIIGKTDEELMDANTAMNCRNTDEETLKQCTVVNTIEIVNDKIYETRKFPVPIGNDKTGVGAYIRDITIQFRQEEFINKISETNRIITECMLKPFVNIQEQLDFALHEAIKLTGSNYGYIYFYDEVTRGFTLNSWTDGVMADCTVIEKQTRYKLDKTGIWGEVVRQRKPIIINDFDVPNKLKKGYPEGHVNIHKFMSIPIFESQRIVAVIGFANKESDYTDNDINTMTVLMSGVWIATKKREKEQETAQLLQRTQSMFNNHEAIMLLIEPLSGKIIEANSAAINFYGYTKEELINMTIQDVNISEKDEVSKLRLMALNKGQKYFTFPHRLKNGQIRTVDVYSSPIEYNNNKVLFSIIFDVTKREEIKAQNEYLAFHDYLTDIYNRRYFDDEFNRRNNADQYPLAIIMGDVNGLKLYNDTFGHLAGDNALREIAKRIKEYVSSEDTFARVGGDEFAIIVSNASEGTIREYLNFIEQKVNDDSETKEENRLTISFGYGIQRDNKDTMDVLLRESEAFMYNKKYYNIKSTRSNIVNTIMETLFTKSEREQKHSERVGLITEAIAKKMNLDKQQISEARVAGFLHDIGKIGIDEKILNKEGKLDKNEWEIMKLHCMKGAGILENTIEFRELSDIILSHHERLDGSGYPNGLKAEEIPIISKIIGVADSYDAMTHDRPYRKKMTHDEAIQELKRCSGILFDPQVVSVFINEAYKEVVFSGGGKRPSESNEVKLGW